MSDITITPRNARIGAEVGGANLSAPLTEAVFEKLRDAFDTHRLLIFRDVRWTVDQQIAFSEKFGTLEDFPDPKDQAEGRKTVLRVTNIDRTTDTIKPVDDPGHKSFTLGTSSWHIDSSFRTLPSKASVLYALEMPEEGGDTMFADSYAAWKTLSDPLKAMLDGMQAIHAGEHIYRGRYANFGIDDTSKEYPSAVHPIARTHPETGRKALYVNRGFTTGIVGLEPDESEALMAQLYEHCQCDVFVHKHKWRPGDVVFWDNRCTMHFAQAYDDKTFTRHMHRTTVQGDRPV